MTLPGWFFTPEEMQNIQSVRKGMNPLAVAYPDLEYTQVDPVQVAADFYLSEGLATHSFLRHQPLPVVDITDERAIELATILDLPAAVVEEFRALRQESPLFGLGLLAQAHQTYLVQCTVATFRWYAHKACGAELRHTLPKVKSPDADILRGVENVKDRTTASLAWKILFEKCGPDAILLMRDMFASIGPRSNTGGPRWAECANVLWEFETGKLGPTETSNQKMFIDRILTLEHNGGCFLSKVPWTNRRSDREKAKNFRPQGKGMKPVLDAHAAEITDISLLHSCASVPMQIYVAEYMGHARTLLRGQWVAPVSVPVPVPVVSVGESDGPYPLDVCFQVINLTTKFGEEVEVDINHWYEVADSTTLGETTWHLRHMVKAQYPGAIVTRYRVALKHANAILVVKEVMPFSQSVSGMFIRDNVLKEGQHANNH